MCCFRTPFLASACLCALCFCEVAEMAAVITGDVVKNHTDAPLAWPTVPLLVGPLWPHTDIPHTGWSEFITHVMCWSYLKSQTFYSLVLVTHSWNMALKVWEYRSRVILISFFFWSLISTQHPQDHKSCFWDGLMRTSLPYITLRIKHWRKARRQVKC